MSQLPGKFPRSLVLTSNDQSHTLFEWAKILGISENTLRYRLEKGWTVDRVLSTPAHPYHVTPPAMVGRLFGRWVVLSLAYRDPATAKYFWNCRCSCGTERVVVSTTLLSGDSQSCGCFAREINATRLTTHGQTRTPLYNLWKAINRRCTLPSHPDYPFYGARGIKVCDRWHDFSNFLADLGPKPPKMTLRRRDDAGDYSLENCHWDFYKVERKSHRLTHEGKTLSLRGWARETGIPESTIRNRLGKGWPLHSVFSRSVPAEELEISPESNTEPDATTRPTPAASEPGGTGMPDDSTSTPGQSCESPPHEPV